VEFFTAQALLGTVALPSDVRFQPLRKGMALLGQKDANQTTQAWEYRGAGSCWQKSARVLKLASCRISDI
jgi:hypothetical protein